MIMFVRPALVDPDLPSTPTEWLASFFAMDVYRPFIVIKHLTPDYYATHIPEIAVWMSQIFLPMAAAFAFLQAVAYLIVGRKAVSGAGIPQDDKERMRLQIAWLFLWLFTPTLSLLALSYSVVQCFQLRYVIYVLPATFLLVGLAVQTLHNRSLRLVFGVAFTALAGFQTLLAVSLPMGSPYGPAARQIRDNYEPGQTVLMYQCTEEPAFSLNLDRPDIKIKGFMEMGNMLFQMEQDFLMRKTLWLVINGDPDGDRQNCAKIEQYLSLRGIEFEKNAYLGRWDVAVYRCERTTKYRAFTDVAALRVALAQLEDTPEEATLRWVLACGLAMVGEGVAAQAEYDRLLKYVSACDRENLIDALWRGGWSLGRDTVDLDEYARIMRSRGTSATHNSLMTDSELRTGGGPVLPLAYRLDEHLGEAKQTTKGPVPDSAQSSRDLLKEQGWATDNPGSELHVDADGVAVTTLDTDYLYIPRHLRLYGPEIDSFRITLSVSGVDRVKVSWLPASAAWDWCEQEGGCFVELLPTAQGVEQTFNVNVSEKMKVNARTIEGIRLTIPGKAQVIVKSFQVCRLSSLFPEPVGVSTFKLGNSERACLYTRVPATLAYRIKVPEAPAFSVGFGVLESDDPVEFRVDVESGQNTSNILCQPVAPNQGWQDAQISLEPFAGKEITLVLRCSAGSGNPIALWANPVVEKHWNSPSKPDEARTRPLNVLLYVVDCLRADHLDLYGYHRNTAPTISELAQRGLVFRRSTAPATCTRPSMASLFGGMDMLAHGYECERTGGPVTAQTFPELMREAGYTTFGVSENPYTPPDNPKSRQFCQLEDLDELAAARDGATFNAVDKFLAANSSRPFFLYVHTMECHAHIRGENDYVYSAPPPHGGRWSSGESDHLNGYDESIGFADANFGRVWDRLKALGLERDTLIIFTADHGEGFLAHEDRYIHGYEPFDELTSVPLLMHLQGALTPGSIFLPNVQSLDLAPTILDMAGLPPCAFFQGRNLNPYLRGAAQNDLWSRIIYSYAGMINSADTPACAILGESKLFGGLSDAKVLFRLDRDPLEKTDYAPEEADTLRFLQGELKRHSEEQMKLRDDLRRSGVGAETVSPADQEVLRAVGYMQ
jgi:hypothetical protein